MSKEVGEQGEKNTGMLPTYIDCAILFVPSSGDSVHKNVSTFQVNFKAVLIRVI